MAQQLTPGGERSAMMDMAEEGVQQREVGNREDDVLCPVMAATPQRLHMHDVM